ncbi:hypothetical protein [Candidatus Laterigemmans baculatus]|uniref:hypothetical protein n=1 Tax=Candidatus Laterigemmans baculatus TaxID=2770505 RepID=UPI0013D9CB24|nr:hypothetical protein [Candidatus Laterigemmans baculatus]
MADDVTLTSLARKQELLSHHVRLVARKHSHALFVFGAQGGLGKSRTILQTLSQEGIDPVLINSHVTPLALFGLLYEHREDEVMFFDDVDSMLSSMAHLGLLRSALWGNPRTVTYNSSQAPEHLPTSFEFTSRIIIAANVIPKRNDAFNAVLSRCDQFELSATNDEVIELMRAISAYGFQNLSIDECSSVIDYIDENCGDRQLSMRLLTPSLRKLQYARQEGLDWRPMVKSQLSTLGRKGTPAKRLDNKSRDLRVLREAIRLHPDSAKDQQVYWCGKTSKSRASFYRLLSRHRDELEANTC